MKGKLIFEDGEYFEGDFLTDVTAEAGFGEVVFNTSMAGYQESLTDPSYCGHILTLTYPLIGNYGINKAFMQSKKSHVGGFVIGELCEEPNSWQSENTLAEFLREQNIPCLYNVDTRAVTRKIRNGGALKGIIVAADMPDTKLKELLAGDIKKDVVAEVTTPKIYLMGNDNADAPHVVAMDFGVKKSILRSLHSLGAKLTVVPAHTTAEEILALKPDGIFLSNGPGDPAVLESVIGEVKKLLGTKPIFGICLGHQLLALALGASTYKMKFGHRGSNQPVKNLRTGKVQITAQNHGYAVSESSLAGLPLEVTHINVNDETIEGVRHKELPIFSVQYHPEAAPGPDDNVYLFEEFWAMMRGE